MTIRARHFRLTFDKGPLIVDNQYSIELDPKIKALSIEKNFS